jgi:hypothetical protein
MSWPEIELVGTYRMPKSMPDAFLAHRQGHWLCVRRGRRRGIPLRGVAAPFPRADGSGITTPAPLFVESRKVPSGVNWRRPRLGAQS